jgi:PAS domain-containing protein
MTGLPILKQHSILLAFLLPFLSAFSLFGEVPFPLKVDMNGKNLHRYITVLEDTKAELSYFDVTSGKYDANFKRVNSENLGFSKSQFWVRLPVENKEESTLSWLLEFNFPLIDEIEIYASNIPAETIRKSGDLFPFHQRSLEYRNVVFTLHEAARSEAVYYIRIKSESTIPLALNAWSHRELISKMNKEQIVIGLFYGIMLVMALYNLIIYLFTRDISYILYVLFIIAISLFHLSNNGLAFQYLWPNSLWWSNFCLPFFMTISCIFGVIFTIFFLDLKKYAPLLERTMFIWCYVLVASSILTLILPYRVSVLTAIGSVIPSSIIMIISGFVTYLRKGRTASYYLISWTAFLLGVILYSLKSLGVLPDNQVTRWTIQIGTALEVILLSLGLADKINTLSRSLQENLKALSLAKVKIEDSEKRFREIFQGTEEIVFLLNEDTQIINANRAITKHLGYRTDDIKGKKLADLLFPMKGKKEGFNLLYLNDKLTELKMVGKVASFQVEFGQKYVKEPKDMYVRLQYIEFEDSREILATLSPQYEDILQGFIDSERIDFTINNYLRNAELVSQKVTANLGKYLDPSAQTEVRTSLREIIINAIEHGNLSIGFEEKSEALLSGTYLDFLQKRQEDPRYNRKSIKIEYVFNDEYVAYRITDEGKGFDHKKVFQKSIDEINESFEQHGRGIFMTRSVFDRVEYNDAGNQVRLIKYFRI